MASLVYGRVAKRGVVAILLAVIVFLMSPGVSDGSFKVQTDAFSISNAPGWCFAMAAFSRWYYLTYQDAPPLRQALSKRGQQRIASELQNFYSRHLIKIQADYCNRHNRNLSESFRRFLSGLICGEPRIVLLMNKGPRGAVLHAVLAYAWVPEQNIIRIYDPNYCNEERFIDLDRKKYTSLDITYDAICFPEILHNHAGLVKKMKKLHDSYSQRRVAQKPHNPVAIHRETRSRPRPR
jgi:hypothetical protein